jgi:hypothetical protein
MTVSVYSPAATPSAGRGPGQPQLAPSSTQAARWTREVKWANFPAKSIKTSCEGRVRKARRSQHFVRGRESGREQALGSVAETPRRFESVRSCGRGRVHPCCSVERGGARASQRSTPRNGASCNRKPYFRLQLRPVKVRHPLSHSISTIPAGRGQLQASATATSGRGRPSMAAVEDGL